MDDIDWSSFEEDLLSLLQDYGIDSTTLPEINPYAFKFLRGVRTMIARHEKEQESLETRDD